MSACSSKTILLATALAAAVAAPPRANARDIVFPDAKQLFIGSSGTGAPDERAEQ